MLNFQLLPMHWLIFFVVLIGIELATMGLTTVWFAGGALAGLIVNFAGGTGMLQVIVFLIVSFALLIFTRPIATKYINRDRVKTNADELVGEQAVVTEEIDNLKDSGRVILNGMDWKARLPKEAGTQTIPVGTTVTVAAIEGVKVIVKENNK